MTCNAVSYGDCDCVRPYFIAATITGELKMNIYIWMYKVRYRQEVLFCQLRDITWSVISDRCRFIIKKVIISQ